MVIMMAPRCSTHHGVAAGLQLLGWLSCLCGSFTNSGPITRLGSRYYKITRLCRLCSKLYSEQATAHRTMFSKLCKHQFRCARVMLQGASITYIVPLPSAPFGDEYSMNKANSSLSKRGKLSVAQKDRSFVCNSVQYQTLR